MWTQKLVGAGFSKRNLRFPHLYFLLTTVLLWEDRVTVSDKSEAGKHLWFSAWHPAEQPPRTPAESCRALCGHLPRLSFSFSHQL